LLYGLGVVLGDIFRKNPAGEEIHAVNHGVVGKCASEFYDISNLPARIGITPQLEILPSDQTMNAHHQDVEALSIGFFIQNIRSFLRSELLFTVLLTPYCNICSEFYMEK
jgi:hypothetical protein